MMGPILSGPCSVMETKLGRSRIQLGVLMQAQTCRMPNILLRTDGSGLADVCMNM
jgi:hypothetical protein